ncbi:tryptophan-rich sensory protein [Sphingomonas donggukensis]|uniref:Tryptophan-rich sensory protein n=1 Tax=Sphingomonas donggukensis TaxID=2949093 RepID=A0ABY4TR56_9SPHN|nr:TspO/MBR family protein [Sphingomonas donggukensis]URW74778.1 tryptophan-rich sensory protein [Sphingomonas donggukensis]
MSEIASRGQLRASFLRWAIVTVPLIVFLGFLSGRLVPSGDDNAWYAALVKPALTPPGIVFPIAWTILYVLLGLALAMIADARGARGRGLAIALFAAQLAANLPWSPLFFGAHMIAAAFGLIVAMLLLSVATTFAFARIRKAAAWLMVPYMVWICFAGALTWSIGQLNPGADGVVSDASSTQIAL